MSMLNKKFTEEHKKKLSIAHMGKTLSEEHKKKLSVAHIGKKHSEETKKKIGFASKGNKYCLGRKLSKEVKQKYSDVAKKFGFGKWMKGKKHSEETKRKIGQASIMRIKKGFFCFQKGQMKGDKNVNWKGGITPENKKIRASIEHEVWRNAVFANNGYTCQKYGIKGGKLHAHHIQNFAQHPELRFAIDNGITLSEKAHKEFHKIYGIKNNTKEQLEEFLKT